MKGKKLKEGFTLIEVLLVLGIIAILTSIAVPSVKGIINQAQATKIVTDMKNVQVALMNYYIYNNDFSNLSIPKLIDEGYLDTAPANNIGLSNGSLREIKITYTGLTIPATNLRRIDNSIMVEGDNAYLTVSF
ncbi:type II secretion system protein [Petrotoga sp. 9PWA.NaAc.5.4]|uniref:type II secretion system protein n=1 Tax=Petrotoga sp. 9PWA.NaAc.5.4 TaxID=1434328 RepID=UPI000CB32D99|nr:prepilin-type N-terminal cleavage/methylation domain-containing protein [Petrotoga sp. 9PWA.NaAc.5.4]PNR94641.1 pilus assembly protein PilA [Petrotoga sp. 9PWA.NaAc.5.4]